ncbi:MAG: hypothetical protein KF835_02045 [Xanthobacteraceae bacterium]|nr:hypothetical protein [Xanthobacteraceae bacterium]
MSADKFSSAIGAVDWNGNVAAFLKNATSSKKLQDTNERIAIWARQFEIVDKGNPALSFVREMQLCGLHVAALIALGLYKSAAASMRAIFETALYYTYFRTHPTELASLVRLDDFYLDKKELLEYHKTHTPNFVEFQSKLGVLSQSKKWYAEMSGIIHGQTPGKWSKHTSLSDIKTIDEIASAVVDAFAHGVEITHHLFLCTVAQEMWDQISSDAKEKLRSGLAGDVKQALGLDAA